jgi:hypothetical protein
MDTAQGRDLSSAFDIETEYPRHMCVQSQFVQYIIQIVAMTLYVHILLGNKTAIRALDNYEIDSKLVTKESKR